ETNQKKVGSPMYLETSGLVFNQKTGIAHTAEKITFELPQGSGSAVGATYDSRQNTFKLHSDIRLLTDGPKPVNMHADSAVFVQEQQQVTVTGFWAESGIRRLEAQRVAVHLRNDNTVDHADASGGVDARIRGARPARLHAENAGFTFGAKNKALSGRLTGEVSWEMGGASASRGKAGQVLLAFGANNQIKSAQLRENVEIAQLGGTEAAKPAPATDAGTMERNVTQPGEAAPHSEVAQGAEFRGAGLDLKVSDGSELEKATSVGAAQIVFGVQQPSGVLGSGSQSGKTVITAGHFEANFSGDNHLSTLTGTTPVKIVTSAPSQPDRISESRDLLATFSKGKTQNLEELVQTGNVQIQEGQRLGTANRANYNATSDA